MLSLVEGGKGISASRDFSMVALESTLKPRFQHTFKTQQKTTKKFVSFTLSGSISRFVACFIITLARALLKNSESTKRHT